MKLMPEKLKTQSCSFLSFACVLVCVSFRHD
jgi:hypothetical protein